MGKIVLHGWNTGFNKVAHTKLLRTELSYSLAQAKSITDALMDGQSVTIDQMAVGEDDLPEKALLLIESQRFHDGSIRACQHSPRLVEIEQQRAEAVTILLCRAVINLQPSCGGADRSRSRTNASTVPMPLAAVCQAMVPAPMNQIGRLGQPNVIASQLRAAGPMQRIVFAADLPTP